MEDATIVERAAPEVLNFRPEQTDYFAHLLSSWYGWRLGSTGFIMPNDYWRSEIKRRIRKAAHATLRNRP